MWNIASRSHSTWNDRTMMSLPGSFIPFASTPSSNTMDSTSKKKWNNTLNMEMISLAFNVYYWICDAKLGEEEKNVETRQFHFKHLCQVVIRLLENLSFSVTLLDFFEMTIERFQTMKKNINGFCTFHMFKRIIKI